MSANIQPEASQINKVIEHCIKRKIKISVDNLISASLFVAGGTLFGVDRTLIKKQIANYKNK